MAAMALGVFLVALAYYWSGNPAHEWLGLAFFVFLLTHNGINRHWYARTLAARPAPRQTVSIAITAVIALACTSLIASSVLISETLFAWLDFGRQSLAKQIHAAAGWWLLVITGLHLGLRWPMIAGLTGWARIGRKGGGLAGLLLTAGGLALAIQGLRSAHSLGLAGKLFLQPSPEWWDFEQAGAAFLLHGLAVLSLCVLTAHQVVKRLPIGRAPLVQADLQRR